MKNDKHISANALITAIINDPYIHGRAYARVRDHIDDAPAVDAVEVVHGRWVALDDEYEESEDQEEALRWGCSACHELVEYDDWTHRSRLTKFCPNCGAKMDGGNEDV